MKKLLTPVALLPVLIGLVVAGFAMNAQPAVANSKPGNLYSPSANGPQVPNVPDPGKYLFEQGCSTCHGLNGQGSQIAPSLQGVGAAAVDFYVGTGRMPLAEPQVQAPRKQPAYSKEQIAELAKYVSSFGDGPPVPSVDPSKGNLTDGNALYANNCAACHNSQGSGGALGSNYYAPQLYKATPTQIAEAVRIGPGAMPIFGPGTFNQDQMNSLVKYVGSLKNSENPGGLSLGKTGPVPEGFFAWIVGLGAMLAFARWIGTRV